MGKKIKMLLCTYHETDCGLDNLYDGLCRVLDAENVYEYPEKPFLHGTHGKKYSWYPLFFDWPVAADENTKLEMLKRGEFDYILFSNRILDHIQKGIDSSIKDKYINLLELIKSTSVSVIILDQNDGIRINDELIDMLNPVLYFKRDLIKSQADNKIVPLNFCYSEKYIPDVRTKRTNTLFWIGARYGARKKYIKVCQELAANEDFQVVSIGGHICQQKEYSERLLRNKIGLNLRGYGFDCMRYYEIPAHGTLLFSQRLPVIIENDYTDMENAVLFDNVEDMASKLKFLLNHEDIVDRIRIKGYEHIIKYHTSKIRAQQLIDRIKNI